MVYQRGFKNLLSPPPFSHPRNVHAVESLDVDGGGGNGVAAANLVLEERKFKINFKQLFSYIYGYVLSHVLDVLPVDGPREAEVGGGDGGPADPKEIGVFLDTLQTNDW